MTTNKTAAALRKEVYDFIAHLGVKMSANQQTMLSSILKSVYEHRVIESRKENDAPVRHEIVCPKCQGVKIIFGQGFKNYRKSIKKAGGAV